MDRRTSRLVAILGLVVILAVIAGYWVLSR
jgi:hypothetical protein